MDKPIGYWLKLLDRRIEAVLERALAEHGLTRRHWQVLNVLREAPASDAALTEALRPFWEVEPGRLAAVTGDLAERGWATRDDAGEWRLTTDGTAGHAAMAERVAATRRRVAEGISPDEYATTIDVLRRMAENLAPAAS